MGVVLYVVIGPPISLQSFAQWEAAKLNIIGNPRLHIFTLANVIQRPIIIYSHPDSPIGCGTLIPHANIC